MLRACGAALLALTLMCGCDAAPTPGKSAPDEGADAGVAEATEMAEIFEQFCLRSFPIDGAIDAVAAQRRATALSASEVAGFLNTDPGRGWRYHTGRATYVITIEHPPVRACAVRRMTGAGLPTAQPYLAAITAYADRRGLGPLYSVPEQHAKIRSGADITGYSHYVREPGRGRAAEIFMLITIDYHGRYGGELAADVPLGDSGIEVRYIHQLPPASRAQPSRQARRD